MPKKPTVDTLTVPGNAALRLTKLRYSIQEFMAITGAKRTTVFKRIQRNELKTILDGRKRFISADEMVRYCNTPRLPIRDTDT